ncbi:hypothetical protein A2U01_0110825, partial [Trifolium medium]|nr:hypothetical protein [Trifolium medium]
LTSSAHLGSPAVFSDAVGTPAVPTDLINVALSSPSLGVTG